MREITYQEYRTIRAARRQSESRGLLVFLDYATRTALETEAVRRNCKPGVLVAAILMARYGTHEHKGEL